jgi:hypothetical protein
LHDSKSVFAKRVHAVIEVEILGGLGNQMFQYALGRKLAFTTEQELVVNRSPFKTFKAQPFLLDKYFLDGEITDKPNVRPYFLKRVIFRLGKNGIRFGRKLYFAEESLEFHPEVLNLRGSVCLRGYWQSEKYFRDVREQLLNEFKPKQPLSLKAEEFLARIKARPSASLHVRRGDYITTASATHGALKMDFYKEAIAHLLSLEPEITFFVFSDDPKWVSVELAPTIPNPCVVVSGNGLSEVEEMQLMSACQHNIIANSSFSWWGAWLNKNPNKVVIAPKNWFQSKEKSSKDIVPENWLRL